MSTVAGVILFFMDVSFLFASVYLVSFVSFLMPSGSSLLLLLISSLYTRSGFMICRE